MQEVSHHGQLIKAYREQAGLTQEELASLIGRSRRTLITLEQVARIRDMKVRRTLAWALHIPHELLGISAIILPHSVVRSPLEQPPVSGGKNLSRVVFETLRENLRMRLDLYYLGSALGADQKLNDHLEHLTGLVLNSSLKDRRFLLELLSHNYQVKGMIARDQLDYATADACFTQASLVAQEAECPELHALALARQATTELWRNRPDSAAHLYEIARDIAKRAPAALRTYLAAAHAEAQGTLDDERCLASLTFARSMLKRIDPEDALPHEKSAFGYFTKPPTLGVFSNSTTRSPLLSYSFAKRTEVAIMCSLRQIFREATGGVAVVLAERFGVGPCQGRQMWEKEWSSKQTRIAQAIRTAVSRGIVCPETRAAGCLCPGYWLSRGSGM